MKRLFLVFALLSTFVVFSPNAVLAVGLSSLSSSATTVTGGNTVTGTIKLAANAPTGGQKVTLSSSNTAVMTVPGSVTIAAGKNSGTFTGTAIATAQSGQSTITATVDSTQKTVNISVLAPVISSIAASPTTVVAGNTAVVTVTLSGKAPTGGTQVALTSTAAEAPIAASVLVPAGATTAKVNVVAGVPSATVASTLTATLDGASKTTTLSVTPVALSSIAVSPGDNRWRFRRQDYRDPQR